MYFADEAFALLGPILQKYIPHYCQESVFEVAREAWMSIVVDIIRLAEFIRLSSSYQDIYAQAPIYFSGMTTDYPSWQNGLAVELMRFVGWLQVTLETQECVTIVGS